MKFLLVATLCVAIFSAGSARAQESDAIPQKIKAAPVADAGVSDSLEIMMEALEENDYARFLSVGDDNFKAALTKPLFAIAVAQVGPRLKNGWEADYFGALERQDFQINLWKISFKTGDDLLAEMSCKDGKVSGFALR